VSSILSSLRANSIAAVKALPSLENVRVEPIIEAKDAWGLASKSVGVGWVKLDEAPDGEPPIMAPGSQMVTLTMIVVVMTDSPASNVDALGGDGFAEDILEDLKIIRTVNIGTTATGPVYLRFATSHVIPDPHRVPGGAGPVAIATFFRTSEFEY
jgi:hypothetical protein